MNSANRTLAFVLVAACSVGIAVGAHRMYQPSAASAGKKTDVGTPFFPDFQDPGAATFLSVAAFNTTTNKVDKFTVEKRDGRWRIPSHHNYPADAKDRLAKTAASIIGVTRGQLVTESATSHARLNLLDPQDDKVAGTEGRGNRITLKNGDTVLTDLIIGKKEEGAGAASDRYYVRRADEDRVYIAEVKPNLSTKFTDWIQPNVLDATASTFRRISLERYTVDEAKGEIVPGIRSELSRSSSTEEWKLDEVPAGKKLKTSVVNQITSSLADMKIVGVRPKTPGIAALIKGDGNGRLSPIDMLDMQEKGFFRTNSGLVSKYGDFLAGTSEGIVYVLRFGNIIRGGDVDIEIGSSKKLTEEEAQKALDEKKAKGEAEEASAEKTDGDEAKKENRFVFVSAQLDPTLLGEEPVEPTKPTPPPGYKPKEKPAPSSTPNIPNFTNPSDEKPKGDDAKPAATEPKKETSAVARDSRSFAGPGPDLQEEPKQDKPAESKPQDEKPADSEKPVAEKPAGDQPPASPGADSKPAEEPKPKDPFAEYEAELAKYEQAMDEYKVRV
jgi:hypothetical protein